jgi:hypothetical protein
MKYPLICPLSLHETYHSLDSLIDEITFNQAIHSCALPRIPFSLPVTLGALVN